MWRGIAAARLGGRVTDIGHAIETYIRGRGTYGIVEDYVGHGIGSAMHQPPNVPNYGKPGRGPKLVGMTKRRSSTSCATWSCTRRSIALCRNGSALAGVGLESFGSAMVGYRCSSSGRRCRDISMGSATAKNAPVQIQPAQENAVTTKLMIPSAPARFIVRGELR